MHSAIYALEPELLEPKFATRVLYSPSGTSPTFQNRRTTDIPLNVHCPLSENYPLNSSRASDIAVRFTGEILYRPSVKNSLLYEK